MSTSRKSKPNANQKQTSTPRFKDPKTYRVLPPLNPPLQPGLLLTRSGAIISTAAAAALAEAETPRREEVMEDERSSQPKQVQAQAPDQPSLNSGGNGGDEEGHGNSKPFPTLTDQRRPSQLSSNHGGGRSGGDGSGASEEVIPGAGVLIPHGHPEASNFLQPPINFPGGWQCGWPENIPQSLQMQQQQQGMGNTYPHDTFHPRSPPQQQQHQRVPNQNYNSPSQHGNPHNGSAFPILPQQQQGTNPSPSASPQLAMSPSSQEPGSGGKQFWPAPPSAANSVLMSSQPRPQIQVQVPRPPLYVSPSESSPQGPISSFIPEQPRPPTGHLPPTNHPSLGTLFPYRRPQLQGQDERSSTPGSSQPISADPSDSQHPRASSGRFVKSKRPAALISGSQAERPRLRDLPSPQPQEQIVLPPSHSQPQCHRADPATLKRRYAPSTTSSPDLSFSSSSSAAISDRDLPDAGEPLFPPDTRSHSQALYDHANNLYNLQQNIEYRNAFKSHIRCLDTKIAKNVAHILGTDLKKKKNVVLGDEVVRSLEVVQNWSGEGWGGWPGWEKPGVQVVGKVSNSEIFLDREVYFERGEVEEGQRDGVDGAGERADRDETMGDGSMKGVVSGGGAMVGSGRHSGGGPARHVSQRGRIITATERAMGSAGRGNGVSHGSQMQGVVQTLASPQPQGETGRKRGRRPGPARHR